MNEILNITKALADKNRVRALMMLTGGELCVCQIIEMLELAPSTVSKHMSILRHAGLVETRKESRWIYYRLANCKADPASEILSWLEKNLKTNQKILHDAKQLERIRKIDKDTLCQHYKS